MPHVAALYRYPIKGLAPEPCEQLQVESGGRIAGDRVLAFRYASATEPQLQDGLDYWPKGGGLCVRDYPALTRVELDYAAGEITLRADGRLLVRAGLDDGGRASLVSAVTEFLLGTPDGARLARAGHLPLSLVGDGRTATFQDRPRGFVTAHSRASARALGEVIGGAAGEAARAGGAGGGTSRAGGAALDDRRFRSNIALDGLAAWAEDDLVGRQVRIGAVTFDVTAPIVRCLATHANPETGLRDAPVMTTLTRTLGKAQPSFGVLMLPVGGGGPGGVPARGAGTIAVGDPVELLS